LDAVILCFDPAFNRRLNTGASDRGRVFAARHAECAFINASTKQNVGRLVADLRTRAAPPPMLVFVGASAVTGRSDRQKLFGRGDRLPGEHTAAAARWSEPETIGPP